TNLREYFNLSCGILAIPDVIGQVVVDREGGGLGLGTLGLREGLDALDAKDPVVDAPHLALLDHDLFLARREEALFLEHVEHVAVRHVEVVVDRLRLEPEEGHHVVGEGPQVVLRHPAPSHRDPHAGASLWPVESMYRWRGRREETREFVIVCKTRKALLNKLIAAVRGMHPSEVPCIVSYPMGPVLPAYLDWIDAETDQR